MSDPCGGHTMTLYNGSICNPGPVKGVYLFEEKPSAITLTNAALEATWDALFILDQPNRGMRLNFDIIEPGEDTPDEVEFSDGSKGIASISKGIDKYKMVSSQSGKKTIYGQLQNGKEMYAVFFTQFGYLIGKEVTANTLEVVKYRVYSTIERAQPKNFSYVNVHFDALENWEEYEQILKPDFDPSAIDTVQNMTFTAGTPAQTTCAITVKNFDNVAVTGLTTGAASYFRVYNNTSDPTHASPITPSGATQSGGVYTLTYASQTIGHVLEFTYLEPSASSEYYDLSVNVTGTVA